MNESFKECGEALKEHQAKHQDTNRNLDRYDKMRSACWDVAGAPIGVLACLADALALPFLFHWPRSGAQPPAARRRDGSL